MNPGEHTHLSPIGVPEFVQLTEGATVVVETGAAVVVGEGGGGPKADVD